jgi:peptidoglycan/LPS O-acetylase OafA/YrhL
VLRIFPVYFFLLILLVVLGYPFSPGELPYQFSFTSNIYMFRIGSWTEYLHTWTLAVEEQFYLLWPWLILFVPDRYHKWLFAICIIVSLTALWIVLCPFYCDEPRYVLTVSNFDAFGLGGLYARSIRTDQGKRWFERNIKFLVGVSLVIFCIFNTLHYLSIYSRLYFLYRFNNAVLALAFIYVVMNVSRGFLKDFLVDNRAVKLTGRISYGIYLYHIPVQFYVKAFRAPAALAMGFDPGFPVWLVLDLALVWIISYFSYQYIEKPFLRYKDRFSISAT